MRGDEDVTMKISINDAGRKRSATVKLSFLPPDDLNVISDEKSDLLHAAGDAIISAITTLNEDDEDKEQYDDEGEYND